jgi:hypothetical protein
MTDQRREPTGATVPGVAAAGGAPSSPKERLGALGSPDRMGLVSSSC